MNMKSFYKQPINAYFFPTVPVDAVMLKFFFYEQLSNTSIRLWNFLPFYVPLVWTLEHIPIDLGHRMGDTLVGVSA